MNNLSKFIEEAEALETKFNEDIDDLAEKFRQEVIIPACKKHNCEFFSGNGTWFFINIETKSDARFDGMIPIGEVLGTQVGREKYLGDHVAAVRLKNWMEDGLKLEDNPTYDLEEQVQFVIGTLKRGEFEFEFDCDGQLILSTGLYLWADGKIREEKETKSKKELTEAQLKTLDEYFSAGNKF